MLLSVKTINQLREIKLGHFRGFEQAGFKFGKLTMLTGENNSGKTSLIYAILSVLQSVDFPFFYSTNGNYIDLGGFKTVVYRHRTDRLIELTFTIDNNIVITTKWQEDSKTKLASLNMLDFTIENKSLLKISKEFREENKRLEEIIDEFAGGYVYVAEISEYKGMIGNYSISKLTDTKLYSRTYAGIIEKLLNAEYLSLFSGIKSVFGNIDYNLFFISSNRTEIKRGFSASSQLSFEIGNSGENFENQINLWEINNNTEFNSLKKVGKELSLFYDIKSKQFRSGQYEIQIKPKRGSVWCSLSDVGDGVKQLLPVIVADIQQNIGATIIAIQPEIELHPSVQADFASYIVNQIRDNNKKYILETHSEFIFNRVRLEITKGNIDEDDVKTYYLHNTGKDTKIYNVHFNKSGQIMNAPDDFFETYELDVLDILMNAK